MVAVALVLVLLAWPALAQDTISPQAQARHLNAYTLDLEQELKRVMVQCAGRRVELDRRAQTIEQLNQEITRLTQELEQLKNPPQEE